MAMTWKEVNKHARISDAGYIVDTAVVDGVTKHAAWEPGYGSVIGVHDRAADAQVDCEIHKLRTDKLATLKAGDVLEVEA